MHYSSLQDAVCESIRTAIPSTDFYARPGDYETTTLDFIDPHMLMEKLGELEELQRFNEGD